MAACKILRRDNYCGGVKEYIEHLAWLLLLRFLDPQEEIWQTGAALEGKTNQRILDSERRLAPLRGGCRRQTSTGGW